MPESARLLPDLIEAYIDYLSPCEVPLSFKRWAGIALVAGAMERRFWAWGRGYRIHPNIFVLLIGRPGVGKNVVIDPVVDMWSATGKFNIVANRATLPAFLESAAFPQIITDEHGEKVMTNPCVMGLGEFGHLFRENDTELMNAINAFYDAKDGAFVDRTISRGLVTIDKPILTMVAGTQPQYLDKVLPEEAFQLGFATRLAMVYESAVAVGQVFGEKSKPQPQLFKAIVHDLCIIKELSGEFKFDKEAQDHFESWYVGGCQPVPDHTRLQDYNARRWATAFKLCQILTISRGDSLIVRADVVRESIELLTSAERTLPEAFAAMGGSSDNAVFDYIFNFVWKYATEKGKPVPERLINNCLKLKVPVHRHDAFMKSLIASGTIVSQGAFPPGMRLFMPGDRTQLLD